MKLISYKIKIYVICPPLTREEEDEYKHFQVFLCYLFII